MDPNQVAARIDVEAAGELAEEPHPVEDDLHSNGSEPETPEPEVTDEGAVEEQEQEVAEEPIYRQGGEELADAAADAEEDIDDGDEFEDDYLSGDHDEEYVADDRIGADYDMRNYADYEDDENDGSDDREHLGLVSDNEAIDEDESEDDDEEGSYDGEYDEDDDYGQYTAQPRSLLPSGPPPAKAAPVVIDLISDSEDEDEQKAPTPRQPQPPTIKRGTGEEGDEDEDEDEDEEGSENGEEDDSEEDELEEGSEDFEDDLTAEEGLVRDAAGDSESEDGNISGTVGSHNHAVGSRREEEEKAESVEGEVSEVSEPSELLDEEEEELLEDDEEEEELVVVEEKSVTKQVIVEASINQPQAAQALDEKGAEQAKEAQPEPEEGPTLQHHQQGNDAVTDEKQASAESDEAGPQSSSQLVSPIASQPEQAAEKERDHGDTPMSEVPQEAPPTEDQSPQLLEDPSMELDAEHEPVAEETRPSEEKDEDMADVQEAEPSVEGDQSMVDAQEIASTAERDESMADAQESRQSVEQDEDMASVRTVEPVAEDEDMASVHEPPREKDEDMADVQDVGPTAGHGPEIPTEDVLIERRDAPVAPSSPPLTQEQFETQAVEKDLYISTAIERPSQEDVQEAGQLLTPLETQTSEALVHATESVVEEQDETQDTPEVLHEAILPSTSAVAPSAVEHAELAKEAAEPAAASPKLGETPASERAVEPPVEHVDLPEAVTQQVDEPNSKGLHGEVTDARTTAEGDNTLSDEPDLEARSTGEPDLAHNLSAEKAETPTRHQIEESHLEESAQPEQTNMETPAVSSPRLGQEEKPDQPIASQPTQDAITVAVGGEASLKSLAHISSSPGTAHLPDDPSIQLARAALPPKRGKRTLAPTQEVPRTTRATSKSLQREPESDEDTSVQLAKAAINSPTKKGRELDGTATQMKLELTKRLRTEMPDCVTLKTLRSHLNKNLDAAVVATTQPPDAQRAKGGPRQYMMSFNVTDPSVAPMHVVEVQFYRAHKDYLPVVKPGDAILLRGFTVVALKDKGFGLRTHDASSWAVFDREDGLAQIRGPPVELSDEEVAYLTDLRKWYGALGEPAKAKLDKANQKFAEVNHAK
ncbi:hypothetical protein NKR23_g5154 [Pleurostoma richardsiae]|uniref:Telomeric single stranded DNA binding POT1/Cdc13 domain-containing protein n=1 Tax=Pleurostoma richardsiae TaxID=41990 RepID=A0AA38REA7_9PEZI|nr:hypothetical protein NKR23_g5154 [Pleurostoma richardsiae]